MVDIATVAVKGVEEALDVGKELVDRLTPDRNARAAEKAGAQRAGLDAELALGTAAGEINKVEAASASLLIAGWRPALGWICDICVALYFIPLFITSAVIYAMLFYQSCKAGLCVQPPKPPVDIAEILSLLGTLMTGNVIRSVDKWLGTDTAAVSIIPKGIKSVVAKIIPWKGKS